VASNMIPVFSSLILFQLRRRFHHRCNLASCKHRFVRRSPHAGSPTPSIYEPSRRTGLFLAGLYFTLPVITGEGTDLRLVSPESSDMAIGSRLVLGLVAVLCLAMLKSRFWTPGPYPMAGRSSDLCSRSPSLLGGSH
jgi:hypothetical protein